MNPTQKEIYEKTVKRLARIGVKDPTAQIVALAEEIEQYRSKIEHLQAYIRENCQWPPQPKEGRYTRYDPELERFVVPSLYKLNGEQITFYFKTGCDECPRVWGEVIDALAYYENEAEEAKS